MSEKVYYITEFPDPKDRFKFQAQIEQIFSDEEFIALRYPKNYLLRSFWLGRLFFTLPKRSIIFFIHPLYSRTSKTILQLGGLKKCIPVCIVSDINSLREENFNLEREIGYWKSIRYFVFHNDKMKMLADKKTGVKTSVNIPMFDLLFEPPLVQRKNSHEVVFTGNIEKSPFVSQLYKIKNIEWNIYSASEKAGSLGVKHTLLTDDVTDRKPLSGSYGLVWEGNSLENISNFMGRYLEWVAPLKLSHYLLNSLPVITHKNAAIAELVLKNNIGFCVDSLPEIAEKIEAIREDQYQAMVENARKFSTRISTGYHTKQAIESILSRIRADDQLS